jgi:murein DD-endopeptidase MepM/ murein hydrolase activator NlpD
MQVLLLVVALLAVLAAAPGGARADSPSPDTAVWPLDPRPAVVAGFDPPDTLWGAGHRGVDLLGRPGQPVRAALAGTVTFAGTLAGRGVVVVDHGTTRTTYEPVAAVVAVGTVVATGGPIGHLQAGLSHCPPRTCLHWGLLRGEDYLDPLSLLGLGPVRLLPLSAPPLVPWPAFMPWPVFMRGDVPAGTPFAAFPR